MKIFSLLVFLVLAIAMVPSHVSAGLSFPHDGATLTYAVTDTASSSLGSITAVANDSYIFHALGDSWNVTESYVGKVTCSPNSGTLSVKFDTLSDILGQNAVASSNPNIVIQVSYVIQDRMVVSTPIGSNVPAAYTATCNFGGNNQVSVSWGTPALYVSGFKFYVFTYIDPTGVTSGSSVPASIMVLTVSGTQSIQVFGKSRTAIVGTLTGFIPATMYWDSSTGILLLEKSPGSLQTEVMQLTQSPDLMS